MKNWIFTLVIGVSSLVNAGDAGGHGGDNRHLTDVAAWFPRYAGTSDRTITYCYVLDPKFSIQDKERIENSIETAYHSWYDYVSQAKDAPEIRWVSKTRDEARLIKASPSCDENVDLRFYLGYVDSTLKKEIKDFRNPAAFSRADSRDPETGWAKGHVWFHPANDIDAELKFVYHDIKEGPNSPATYLKLSITWAAPSAFELAMKHEMGHIFGVPHIEGTIMDIDFLKWMPVAGLGGPRSIPLLSIDRANAILERSYEEWPILLHPGTIGKFLPGMSASGEGRMKANLKNTNGVFTLEGAYKQMPFSIKLESANDSVLSSKPLRGTLQTALVSCSPWDFYAPNEGKKRMIKCFELKQTSLVKEFKVRSVAAGRGNPAYSRILLTRNMSECDKGPYGLQMNENEGDRTPPLQVCPIW